MSTHLSLVPAGPRLTPKGHLQALRSQIGKAAILGGRPYVERIIKSDAFAARFMSGLDGEARMAALATITRILAGAPERPPPPRAISPAERVKVRWTDDMIARFKREAMRCADNRELAVRLGLPAYCEGAMRAARSRYFRHATVKAPARPAGRPCANQMALAA